MNEAYWQGFNWTLGACSGLAAALLALALGWAWMAGWMAGVMWLIDEATAFSVKKRFKANLAKIEAEARRREQ